MRCQSMEHARKQSQLNADYFGVPYVAFIDTSGNARSERLGEGQRGCDGETFFPSRPNESPTQ